MTKITAYPYNGIHSLLTLTKEDGKIMNQELEHIMPEEQDTPHSRVEIEEDILEKLCQWNQKGSELSYRKVCQHFGISRWTLNMYLKMLYKDHYIEEPDDTGVIWLTEYGKTVGREYAYRHDSLSQFLQLVGVDRGTAETEACRMEHVIGEETVDCICRFVNYGNTFERILKYNTLREQYEPGTYQFLMGIYQLDHSYPRKLAAEYEACQPDISLEVGEEDSWFCLRRKKEGKDCGVLWYMDEQASWQLASATEQGYQIPAGAFEYIIKPGESMTEGTAMIAFAPEGQTPVAGNCRELEVDIW